MKLRGFKVGDRVAYIYGNSEGTGIITVRNKGIGSIGSNWFRVRQDRDLKEHDFFYSELTLIVDGNDILKDMVNK